MRSARPTGLLRLYFMGNTDAGHEPRGVGQITPIERPKLRSWVCKVFQAAGNRGSYFRDHTSDDRASRMITSTPGAAWMRRSSSDRPNQRRYQGWRLRPKMMCVMPYSLTNVAMVAHKVGALDGKGSASQLPGEVEIVVDLALRGRVDFLQRFPRASARRPRTTVRPSGRQFAQPCGAGPRRADYANSGRPSPARNPTTFRRCRCWSSRRARSSRKAISSIASSRSCVSFS